MPNNDRSRLNPTLAKWCTELRTRELLPGAVLKQIVRKSSDVYSAEFAAFRAVDAATLNCWEELGLPSGVKEHPFHAKIGLHEATTILEKSWLYLYPVPLRVPQDSFVCFDHLVRGLKHGRLQPCDFNGDSPGPESDQHRNLIARTMGIVQQLGLICDKAVCCGAGRANFDFALRTRNDKLVIFEIMTGGWPFRPKRAVADNAVEDGIIPILIGALPPWDSADRFPLPRALLWGEHGVHTATGSPISETRMNLTPPVNGVHYFPAPEICDATARLALATILGFK